MRLWDNLNSYLAFKLKELEFRIHTRRRAKEISRAYDTHAGHRVKIDFSAVTPYAVKAAKVSAVAVAALLLVFAAIKTLPLLHDLVAAPARTDSDGSHISEYHAGQTGFEEIPRAMPVQEIPEGVDLPEASVLPEGYAGSVPADDTPSDEPVRRVASPSDKPVVDIFRAGAPRRISLTEWLILVDKSAKQLYMLRDEADGWNVVKAFEIATGEREGRKMVEGDKKTPQGVYFIVGRKHRSELTNLYGPAAFILDYPNEDDRRAGRTGHGIWIHGSERGNIPPLFTAGCVATSNPDILQVAQLLGNGIGVPVIIVSGTEGERHLRDVDFRRLRTRGEEVVKHHGERQAEFERIVMDWKRAWESKDIEAYTTFYSTRTFRHGTQTWEAYRNHKLRTFGMYATINVDVSNFSLTELTPNGATVKFLQVFSTNLNRIENAKRIIFTREQDSWKIHREIPFPKEELLL